MKEELLKGLTEEQIAKIKACKNHDEILALIKNEGVELTDEQLAAVTGGCGTKTYTGACCPVCDSILSVTFLYEANDKKYYRCNECGYQIFLDTNSYIWGR